MNMKHPKEMVYIKIVYASMYIEGRYRLDNLELLIAHIADCVDSLKLEPEIAEAAPAATPPQL